MACGTPVVAYRAGGLEDIIEHNRTGYLVSRRSPEAFARFLGRLLSSPGLREAMGRRARERAETMGWERVAGRVSSLYQALLEGGS
jgi:glycosyltransferase involved in cell wall biosynthesis